MLRVGIWHANLKNFTNTVELPLHGYRPMVKVGSTTKTVCDKQTYFDPIKGRTLASIDMNIGYTSKTVDGIVWKWTDGSVTSSPTTYKGSAATTLTLDKGTKLIGFATNEKSIGSNMNLIYSISLLEKDQACVDKQAAAEIGGVVYYNETIHSNLTGLPDVKLNST